MSTWSQPPNSPRQAPNPHPSQFSSGGWQQPNVGPQPTRPMFGGAQPNAPWAQWGPPTPPANGYGPRPHGRPPTPTGLYGTPPGMPRGFTPVRPTVPAGASGGARGCGTVVLGIFVVIVVMFIGSVVVGLITMMSVVSDEVGGAPPRPTPSPTPAVSTSPVATPRPTPTPTPSPSTRPASPDPTTPPADPTPTKRPLRLPERSWETLPEGELTSQAGRTVQRNGLNSVMFPVANCPSIRQVASWTEFKSATAQFTDCQHAAWASAYASQGWKLPKPRDYYVPNGTIQTPCGTRRADETALYCGGSEVGYGIYWTQNAFEQSTWREVRLIDIAAHEFGHHIQLTRGILDAAWQLGWDTNETWRRIELQTQCFAGAMVAKDAGFGFDQDDFDDYVDMMSSIVEDGIHGSHESLNYWGIRGMYGRYTETCLTWTVGSSWVR